MATKSTKASPKKKEASATSEASPASTSGAAAHTAGRGQSKSQEGVVVSNKMNKTVVVAITRQVRHQMYGKYITKTSKCFAHDEQNQCQIGDRVEVVETRPLSKNKHWRVRAVLSRASV